MRPWFGRRVLVAASPVLAAVSASAQVGSTLPPSHLQPPPASAEPAAAPPLQWQGYGELQLTHYDYPQNPLRDRYSTPHRDNRATIDLSKVSLSGRTCSVRCVAASAILLAQQLGQRPRSLQLNAELPLLAHRQDRTRGPLGGKLSGVSGLQPATLRSKS